MKKVIYIILFTVSVFAVGYFITNKYVSNNQYCDVGIRDISVGTSSKTEPTYIELFDMFKQEIEDLIHNRLLVYEKDSIFLSKKGRDVANQVWQKFI